MSGLILCRKERAVKPYFIDCIEKNVSTLEELCYFLYFYTHLLEEWLPNEELVLWLRQELSMSGLADELATLLKQKADVSIIAAHILKKAQYRPEAELDHYEKEMKAFRNATPVSREKQRADYYVKTKNYHKAIWEYCRILKEKDMEDSFASDIYHNLGVAYGRMFDFEQSSNCFLKAYELNPNQKSLKQYKLALRLSEQELEEVKQTKENSLSEALSEQLDLEIRQSQNWDGTKQKALEEAKKLKDENKITEYYDQLERIIHQWQDECRRYMSN